MSTKLIIGTITFWLLAQVICNFVEGNNFLTNTNIADLQTATNHTYTTTASSSGTGISFVDKTVDFFDKILFFDYSMFYEVDAVTGVQTANDFVILRYMFIAIGVVIFIELAVVFKSLISL